MLRDENDNAPTYTPTVYSVTIAEDTAVFTNILNLTCADADSGTSGQFLMAITSGNTGTGFSITDEGYLSVASSLDAETTYFYSLEITATDRHSIQPLSNTAKVSVTVTDVNEHTPQFTNGGSYTALVAENATIGTLVSNVTATDLDIGSIYGLVTYAITSGNSDDMFTIRPTDGMIFVKRPLDRETTGSYSLVIKATDQDTVSPLSSTATLVVTITDINDNAPSCIPCIYGASINESVAIGTTVAQLNCSDADLSPNIISSYAITTGNTTVFNVDGSGLVTTLVALDFESIKSYLLVVTITDGGSPQFSTNTTVSVQVTGTNEFAPVFSNSTYTVSHSEDTAITTTIATVAATDDDHGSDGVIIFALIDGNSEERFQIDPKSGVIELRKQLDRETTELYSLIVQASDQGAPSMSNTATVNVTLVDVNDNAPLCNHSSYVIELAENFTVNGTVVSLQCSDADQGQNGVISYNISSGNTNSTFVVDSTTGILTLSSALNWESQAYYDLIITVADNGSPQRSSGVTVYIVVTAINEFTPTFTQNGFYNLSVTEDTPVRYNFGNSAGS
ncbi:Protocadherin Fat 4 [Desmophyllum pertusum]|uniref:Protocadherin Fat 4 n=1 Tax=Desmophyllum pertusum TaxID=174260 RepID=A0A9W9ZG01_9CNID|nr:Protocadherin Fat 4 [Desmophyllum pertusum]